MSLSKTYITGPWKLSALDLAEIETIACTDPVADRAIHRIMSRKGTEELLELDDITLKNILWHLRAIWSFEANSGL